MPIAVQNSSLNAAFLKSKYDAGLDYEHYLATDSPKAVNWRQHEQQVDLTVDQRRLIAGFTREIRVLVSSGIWCGDCAAQCPMLVKIARATSASARPKLIDIKFVDRDQHIDLSQQIMINAGLRVPTVIFMAEDYEPVSIIGDRTLTRYRAVAARQLGISCPLPGALPGVAQDELNATLQDWLDEFERVHLLLRLSGRLREKHGD
jgi:thiol-disulfide isomerase/thioredoxin